MNIDEVVSEVRLDIRTSSKTGKPYSKLVVKFDNGYEWESFLDKPTEFMVQTLIDGAKNSK